MLPASNSVPPYVESDHPPSASSTTSIADILWILRRSYKWAVLGCLIGLALAVSFVASSTTPYKSSARILLDRSLNRYLQTNRILDEPSFDDSEIGSQVYLLSSDDVVVPVVRSMNLTHDQEFVGQPKASGTKIGGYI